MNKMIVARHIIFPFINKHMFSQVAINTYKTSLVNFNSRLRKPTPELIKNQIDMINLILKSPEKNENFLLLHEIRRMRLMSVGGLELIEEWIKENWKDLSSKNKMLGMNFLIQQRRENFFPQYKEEIENRNDLSEDQKINYVYCKAIVNKKLPKESNYSGQKFWEAELNLLNKIGQKEEISEGQNRRRSPLEIEIESFLKTTSLPFQRQIMVNGISVDFLVSDLFVEVFGSHHYTSQLKIKGYDVFRGLILNQWRKIRFIHSQDFNKVKGIRNKLDYIMLIAGNDGRLPNRVNWNLLE